MAETTSESNWALDLGFEASWSKAVSSSTEWSVTESNSQSTNLAKTEATEIHCGAETEVPGSHQTKFSLMFQQESTTIDTLTDLKLTLCSKYVQNSQSNSGIHELYIHNIPGTVTVDGVTSCTAFFDPPTLVPNRKDCEDEQEEALIDHGPFVPECQDGGIKYDGCQCVTMGLLYSLFFATQFTF